MEFMEVIKKRKSIRKYKQDDIPDKILFKILEAGRLAPSGGNSQNCYFGVIKDKIIKYQLAEVAGNQLWIAEAPIIIAFCVDISYDLADQSETDFGLIVNRCRFGIDFINYLINYKDRKMINTFWENSNPLIPGEHIQLAATNYGLSSCWIGYLDIVKACKILNLPENMVCLFLMPIGYANEEPKEVVKKRIEEIIFFDKWC